MEFSQNENQGMITQMIRDFAEKEIKPFMMEWDEAQIFPVGLFKKMGELGLMGVLVPTEYGGSGFSYQEYVTVVEEISKVDGSIGLSIAAHNSLCTGHILQFGNAAQKQKYLPKLASGEFIGAWGLTEQGSGSDAGGLATVGVKDGDHWVINGAKNFITHGISGDVAVIIVRTGDKGASDGTTAFIIEKGTPGFTGGKKENKLGMRASETSALFFDNCRVHEDQILGKVGEGFKQALKILDGGRISIAALGVGMAMGAMDASIKYAKERVQFGKPIAEFQAISFKLADMATQIEAAHLLTMFAADLKERGEVMTKEGAIAKLYSSEIAVKVANEAVQVFGGYGYTKDYPVEKFYRDAKLCTIGEGTSEIQKIVISRQILK